MRYFITSTGTGIGKTLVTTALCWQLQSRGKKVMALKPVASGFDENDPSSDTALILQSMGLPASMVESVSPWRFSAPLAPPMAAQKEGKTIGFDEVVAFCTRPRSDIVLVEGAGGVMAPLSDHHTMLDWMARLGWPVILVAGSYLGAISHTLSAVEVLRARGLSLQSLVVSESSPCDVPLADTLDTLKKFLPDALPVVHIPRLAANGELWKQVPRLSEAIDEI